MDIKPGSRIALQIKAMPTSEAARKTVVRLCSKDPDVQRINRRRKRSRPSLRTKMRGGRFWQHRMKARSAAEIEPGRRYTILASPDVIRDLPSVRRWIDVQPG